MKHFCLLLVAALLVTVLGGRPVAAQGGPFGDAFAVGVCSTTDYDAVAAKTIGIEPAELRLDLVSGQSLDDIAKSKNVTFDTVIKALMDAHIADIDQAVTDNLITKQQGETVKNLLKNNHQLRPPTAGTYPYPIYGILTDVAAYNVQAVKPLVAAAKIIDMKCADLVREILGGRSIVMLVASRGGQIGAVLDGIVKAYQNALDQDVKDQLITAAQAKGQLVHINERATALISQTGQPALMLASLLEIGSSPLVGIASAPFFPGSGGAPLIGTPIPLTPHTLVTPLVGTAIAVTPIPK